MVAAIGHAMFSLSLGGTFMVVYGSYLTAKSNLARPRVVDRDRRHGLRPARGLRGDSPRCSRSASSRPRARDSSSPRCPRSSPRFRSAGSSALLFFVGLLGAGYLSDIGAFEVLVAGLTDNTRLTPTGRRVAGRGASRSCIAIPPMHQQRDLRPLGPHVRSGMQTLGCAAGGDHRRVGMNRGDAIRALSARRPAPGARAGCTCGFGL